MVLTNCFEQDRDLKSSRSRPRPRCSGPRPRPSNAGLEIGLETRPGLQTSIIDQHIYFLYRLFDDETAPYLTINIIRCRIQHIIVSKHLLQKKWTDFDYFNVIDSRVWDRMDKDSMNAPKQLATINHFKNFQIHISDIVCDSGIDRKLSPIWWTRLSLIDRNFVSVTEMTSINNRPLHL